jgi:hypothetical protein
MRSGHDSLHAAELADRKAQADEQHYKNENGQPQEIDGHHGFLAMNAASLK